MTEQLPDDPDAAVDPRIVELEDQLLRSRAEFVNYRRRTDAQRATDRAAGAIEVLGDLVGVLDDIDRAEAASDLSGGVGVVLRRMRDTLTRSGLVRYGEPGDPFDPALHHAVAHLPVGDVDVPTCLDVVAPGYTYRGQTVRVAQVAVATPADPDVDPGADDVPGPAAG